MDAKKIFFGAWSVTSIIDGFVDLNMEDAFAPPENDLAKQLAIGGVVCVRSLEVRTPVHAFLIDTGKDRVLVDTGAGPFFPETTGRLLRQLEKLEVDPKSIRHILLTHCHPDHVGGLIDQEDHPLFPHATVYLHKKEHDYWYSVEQEERDRLWFVEARRALNWYKKEGRIILFDSEEELLPGIQSIKAFGHTPGHTAYLFTSEGEKLCTWGDIVHTAGLQFRHPKWGVLVDTYAQEGVISREHLFATAVRYNWLIAGAHLPSPGIGHVQLQSGKFSWHPYQKP